jgi:hypothetical protein
LPYVVSFSLQSSPFGGGSSFVNGAATTIPHRVWCVRGPMTPGSY